MREDIQRQPPNESRTLIEECLRKEITVSLMSYVLKIPEFKVWQISRGIDHFTRKQYRTLMALFNRVNHF